MAMTLELSHQPMHPIFIPSCAGTSRHADCYESMSRTPIRDRPLQQPLIGHSRHPFVNPAPHSSFRQSKACPVPRYGTGIQKGGREATSSPSGRGLGEGEPHSTGASSHPRIPDTPAIFILLCGLRKAMVIPAIKSTPRTPIRGWNPEGEGSGKSTIQWKIPDSSPFPPHVALARS